ncbi:sucD [Mytilus edulis]|uniref:SucD n=1 Tax=Mytilus edulis TaxID=6550 RepID=A0A8S3QYG2_MYTED|nr:sucD [Mytilus edulis]
MKIVVVGSSHVRRLGTFIYNRPALHNFNLMNCEVKCLGIGGGKVSNSDHVQTILSFIEKNRPEHVIVHIGGNDLDILGASEDTTEELGLRLILLSQTLTTRFEIKSVTICQLLPRESTRVIASNVYNDLVIKTNRFLKAQIKDQPHCRYWKITGVKHSDRNNYVDGVHFNYDVGMPKYFRNMRGSIIQAMK